MMWLMIKLGIAVFLFLLTGLSAGYYWNYLPVEQFNRLTASAVGVSVGVEETEYSRVAEQLRQRAVELENKQKSLVELQSEVEAELAAERRSERRMFLYFSALTMFLGVVVAVNFYLDWRRTRRLRNLVQRKIWLMR